MRMLLLLRGLPGAGKTTFIKENRLEDYTISSDSLRVLLGSNELSVEGEYKINQAVSNKMWNLLYNIIEERFKVGAFTVLDATNIKGKDMTRTFKLAKDYKYRVYCVDFTDLPLEECIRRDSNREESRVVGREVIEKMYKDLQNNKVPSGIKEIKPSEYLEETRYRAEDLSAYTKIHHIGDIHGCNTVLQEYLKEGIKQDEFYIFVGDYVDRGIENADVIDFLYTIVDYPNVVLLEGNHEIHGRDWVNDVEIKSNEFKEVTLKEFNSRNAEIYKKKMKKIDRKLRQCIIYNYNSKLVLVTHGGLSRLPYNLSLINTEQMVKGVGYYKDMLNVCEAFEKNTKGKEVYQVFGHRNIEQVEVEVNSKCFNLNGNIEYGGNLRTLVLDENGFESKKTPNTIYTITENMEYTKVKDMLELLENHEHIKVKEQEGYNISSYNFTRKAFNSKEWDKVTTKARGLFINTNTQNIVCRGYNKWFNLNEMPETNLDVIQNRFAYPVTVYKKENGFLGLLSYDKETDKVLYATKSELDGEYSIYFKDIILSYTSEEQLYNIVKDSNKTFAFEVVDIKNDPHIIKYKESCLYLLDIIHNTPNFTTEDYETVKEYANILGVEYKEKVIVLKDKESFLEFVEEATQAKFTYNGKGIEGFVLEDTYKSMVKIKTEYYSYWKFMRSQIEIVKKGGKPKIETKFLNWYEKNRKGLTNCSIIELREQYLKNKNKEVF